MRVFLRCIFFLLLLMSLLLIYLPIYFPLTMDRKSFEVVVEGWTVNSSRYLPAYILPNNDTTVISDRSFCSEKLLLLVVVCSAVNNFAERAVIRETWGNFSSSEFKVVFLLGMPENGTLQEIVEEESVLHSDIIQENFIDSYNNLTLKSVMMLKQVANHCSNVSYILKSDDDMFVHILNLLQLIKQIKDMKLQDILLGDLICNAKPIQNSNSKWYAPSYMFNGKVYPRYLSGTCYLLDRSAAVKLYDVALKTPFFHLEDVFITGICAKKARIKPRYYAGFSYQTRPLDPCLYKRNSYIITSHRVTVRDMVGLWKGIKTANCTQDAVKSDEKNKPTISRVPRRGSRCS